MSNTTFQNVAEGIANGTVGSCDILGYDPCDLSDAEKKALLQTLADQLVGAATPSVVLQELKGRQIGGTLNVPAFLYGQVKFIDTDTSRQINLAGSTQNAQDSDSDRFPEDLTDLTWGQIEGRHYKTRTITIPNGVAAVYVFTLL